MDMGRQIAFVMMGCISLHVVTIIEDLNIHSRRVKEFIYSDRDNLITDPAHRQSQ